MSTTDRRGFLQTMGGLAAATAWPRRAAAAERPPSVLILMADQLTARVMSCYGGPVPTPNIDQLAAGGVLFDEATCPTPYCSPSRAALVTGRYPHATGIVLNCAPKQQDGILPADVTTERLLSEMGYETHHYGKWHLHGTDLPYYPDMYRPITYQKDMADEFAKVKERDRERWMQFYGWALPVETSPDLRSAVKDLNGKWDNEKFADFLTKMGRLDWPLEKHYDVMVADRAVERLKQIPDDQPFCLTASFVAPHDPNVCPSPFYEMFDPADIKLPDNLDVREARYDKDWARRIVRDLGERGLREFLRVYYGMVALVDAQVGRILNTLEAQGRANDTIVLLTADHGDMAGSHGMVWKSTNNFYDDIARIPMILRYPAKLQPRRTSIAASLVDIAPTIWELLGKQPPAGIQGRSLAPWLGGEVDGTPPVFGFSERVRPAPDASRHLPANTKGSFMIRGQGWKLVSYSPNEQYLYDLAHDPGEALNLAADPKHRDRLAYLQGELTDWLQRTEYPGDATALFGQAGGTPALQHHR